MPGFTNLPNSAQPPSSGATMAPIDPRYMVTLTAVGEGGESFSVSTSVDETLAVSMNSQWAAPFENILQETMAGAMQKAGMGGRVIQGVGAAAKVFGVQAKNRLTSFQTWQSSSPMDLTIPFTFVAINSAKTDIRDKVVNLLKLVAPTQYGPILRAPGPTLIDAMQGGRKITLRIGQYIVLEPCIVTDVQVQFDNVIGEEGLPLRAKVNVDIKSWYTCFTTQDLDAMFMTGGGGSTAMTSKDQAAYDNALANPDR